MTARQILLAAWIRLCVALGAAFAAAPAFGHAMLLGTDPADRAVVAAAPPSLTLRFNEPVQLVFVRLLDASGRIVAEAPAGGDAARIEVPLPGALPAGNYVVTYRVLSADAHAIAGAWLFAVGVAPEQWPDPLAADLHAPAWRAIAAANRALHFLALALVAGATVFVALMKDQAGVLRPLLRSNVGVAVMVGVATAVLAILAQGGVVLDAPFTAAKLGDLWRAGLATSQSGQSIAAAALLLAAWQAGWVLRARAVWVPAVIAVAALATLAATGHVVTAAPQWLTVPVLLAHAIPALLWVGSFVPLLLALEGRDGGRAVLRFARVAPFGILLLAAAGAAIAFLQVRTWSGLTGTSYGQGLALKSAIVAMLLVVAAINRWRFTPLLQTAPDVARASLRRMIGVEIALGVTILAITAVLAQTPPPRSLRAVEPAMEIHDHEMAEPGYAVGAVAQGKTAIIAVVPARAGRNTLTVALRGDGWTGIAPLSVTASLSNAAAGIEPIVRELPRLGPGIYELTGPEFAVPGEWTVKIDVLISDFERATYTAPIPVQ